VLNGIHRNSNLQKDCNISERRVFVTIIYVFYVRYAVGTQVFTAFALLRCDIVYHKSLRMEIGRLRDTPSPTIHKNGRQPAPVKALF